MSMIPTLRAPTPDDMRSVVYPTADGNPPPAAAPAPPIAPTPTTPGPTAPTGPTSEQQDGYAYLNSVLQEYGLEELSDWAWGQIVAGNSPTMVLQELRRTDAYRRRFHVIFERQSRGLAPISPAEVIAYERQARQLMMAAGLPRGFYDSTDDMSAFLVNDVSLAELNDRIQLGMEYLYSTDATTRSELARLYGGDGNLLAHYLDPGAAVPLIQKQLNAARTASGAIRSGYGALNQAEAEMFGDLGISASQAQGGFGELVRSKELFGGLPGEAEADIARQTQLGAITGDAAAQAAIEARRRQRLARYSGGGGWATDQQGFGGLGTVRT